MKKQSSDIQPTLHSLNVLVRAGRLIKFKGRVASIAPGLSVLAAALFSGGDVQAANECGNPTNNPHTFNDGVITCDAREYNNGITYEGSEVHTVILQYSGITVVVKGPGATVRGASSTSGDIAVLLHHGSVTTDAVEETDYNNHGLKAYTEGTGNATAQMNGGDVTTHAVLSHGLRAEIKNTGSNATAKAELTAGNINIFRGSSSGLSAHTDSIGGAAIAQMSGGKITTHAAGTGGMEATSTNRQEEDATIGQSAAVATVTALMTGGVIETKTELGSGVVASSRGSEGNVLARMEGGTITTLGEKIGEKNEGHAYGVRARIYGNVNSTAIAKAEMTGGQIVTHAHNSWGLSAGTEAIGGAAIAEMTEQVGRSSIITTKGSQAHGLSVMVNARDGDIDRNSDSNATAKAKMSAGTINIHGPFAHGLHVQANGLNGTATAEMHGGNINLVGEASHGLRVRIDNVDHGKDPDSTIAIGAKALMTGGTIHTENRPNAFEGSHGIHADTTGSADVVVEMKGGSITTLGRNSHGLWAEAEARAFADGVRWDPNSTPQAKTIVKLDAGAVVTASGAGSNGIRVSGNYVTVDHNSNSPKFWLGVKDFDVDVAGIVTGGADGFDADDDGAAIRTISDADGGGTIDITDTAIVIAGGSGIAIQDGDGDAVVTLVGTVTGDVLLGAGDDNLTIASAANFDFSHVLDGGSGDNDHLTLHGRTMTSMENVIGWEHLTLSDTDLSLDKGATLDMDLSIEAGSVFSMSGVSTPSGTSMAGDVASASGGGLTIAGDVTNAGALTLSVQDGAAGDVITIDGDYTDTGSGRSVFELDAVMGADGANTDRLEITGNASGEMVLSVAGLDSTAPEGGPLAIYLVSVGGEADDATFTLMSGNYVMSDGKHGVVSGAHLYRLAEVEAQDGSSSTWWA
ncbi:hypothetical protein SLH47_26180, partial [Cognatiyoonia sp. IB215182]|nr:hypothetical protein [Cognatiyoonia sp. IB215182]